MNDESPSFVPRALTVPQMAVALAVVPEIVRRRIRSRDIDGRHVSGSKAYFIAREALADFNVSLPLALERLQAAGCAAPVAQPIRRPVRQLSPA